MGLMNSYELLRLKETCCILAIFRRSGADTMVVMNLEQPFSSAVGNLIMETCRCAIRFPTAAPFASTPLLACCCRRFDETREDERRFVLQTHYTDNFGVMVRCLVKKAQIRGCR